MSEPYSNDPIGPAEYAAYDKGCATKAATPTQPTVLQQLYERRYALQRRINDAQSTLDTVSVMIRALED